MLKQPGTTMLRGMGQSVADGKISEQQCLAFATRKLNAIRTGERTPLSVAAPHAAGAGPCPMSAAGGAVSLDGRAAAQEPRST
jgi:hypothetical protein